MKGINELSSMKRMIQSGDVFYYCVRLLLLHLLVNESFSLPYLISSSLSLD